MPLINLYRVDKKAILLSIIISIILSSCNNIDRTVYYTYHDLCITRFDIGPNSLLYFGRFTTKDVNNVKPNFTSNWGQRDGGFTGYLLFDTIKHSVELIQMSGYFSKVDSNVYFNLSKRWNPLNPNYDPVALNKWLSKIKTDTHNAAFIASPPMDREKEINNFDSSMVKIKIIELE